MLLASLALAQQGTSPDWANKTGAIGVGANTTLGETTGLNLRTWVSPNFGIQGTVGFALRSVNATVTNPIGIGDDSASFSTTTFMVGLYGSYKLAYWQRGHLGLIFGADIETFNGRSEVFGASDETNEFDLLFPVGLQGEWFPTQYLSLFLQGGVRVDVNSGEPVVVIGGLSPNDPQATGLGGDLLGAAGFTVWFQ